jgi:hypothetical protein
VEPLLSVIIEHVFGVYDGNIEVLQSSVNGDSNGLGVVGLNVFGSIKSSICWTTTTL